MTAPSIEITDDDLKFYKERGYWLSPKILDDDEIARLRKEFERVYAGESDFDCYPWLGPKTFDMSDPSVKQFNNGWWVNAEIRKRVRHPTIGYIASRLMDTPEVRLWHDQVLWKPGIGQTAMPDLTNNVGWHQDYAHWQVSNTSNMCTAWIALQDTDESNGAFRIVEGSHKWGLRQDAHTYGEKDLEALKARYQSPGKDWNEVPVVLKAGEASFHHALTFHGSGPNLSALPRLSFVIHMMPAECGLQMHARWHPCATLLGPEARAGDRFDGVLFPTLWPAEAG